MLPKNTDKDWELYGRLSPYFGVLSDEKFLPGNLDEAALEDFFASGNNHIEHVVTLISEHVRPDFNPARCLDFGCGVGRLVLPLARRFGHVVGVDVSNAMLEEAASNSSKFGVKNVEFVQSDDTLSRVNGSFDFIHSYIVLQHIPPARGERLIQQLIAMLEVGGVAALHVTYSWNGWLQTATRIQRFTRWLRENIPGLHGVVNLFRGRPFNQPFMLMNIYDLNRLFSILQEQGCDQSFVQFTSHAGHSGVMLLFRKK